MSYLSILVAFLSVITLTISQNINPKHQIHDESARPNIGLISYQPPTTDPHKLAPHAPRYSRPIFIIPETPHLPPRNGGHRLRPPPKM
ncbi:unnamed protein product [Trifolium pratense]|uniref:Uncharacterized protein n=1 Tax=Trifolium pratense TaxID=57577 RepID=A0ACB0IUS1_TRIPR|nr:unnamed protein product [Trifolium pratense]